MSSDHDRAKLDTYMRDHFGLESPASRPPPKAKPDPDRDPTFHGGRRRDDDDFSDAKVVDRYVADHFPNVR